MQALIVVMLALIGECSDCHPYSLFTDGVPGGVYECQATAVDVLELCTTLDQEELERETRWQCWPTTREWPRVFGCIYRCPGEKGCNAKHGCFCPD